MVCTTKQQKIIDYLKDNQIDIDKIVIIECDVYGLCGNNYPTYQWYRKSNVPGKLVGYRTTQDIYKQIVIQVDNVSSEGLVCNQPVTNCDCVYVGTSLTDLEIDEALKKLPFKTTEIQGIPILYVYIGLLILVLLIGYYLLKK